MSPDLKIGTISEELDSLGIDLCSAQLVNISCSSAGDSYLRWYADIPSGPGAHDGLILMKTNTFVLTTSTK